MSFFCFRFCKLLYWQLDLSWTIRWHRISQLSLFKWSKYHSSLSILTRRTSLQDLAHVLWIAKKSHSKMGQWSELKISYAGVESFHRTLFKCLLEGFSRQVQENSHLLKDCLHLAFSCSPIVSWLWLMFLILSV